MYEIHQNIKNKLYLSKCLTTIIIYNMSLMQWCMNYFGGGFIGAENFEGYKYTKIFHRNIHVMLISA